MDMSLGEFSDDFLRRIIADTAENDSVDAKGPMAFSDAADKAGLAKDIAAFANSNNGGWLVIGKKQTGSGQFSLEGLSEDQAASFETTVVAQWVNNRFAPEIQLECRRVEHDGNTFIVIRINEFDDVPVICTKRCDDPANSRKPILDVGCIYIRGRNAESKPLQTQEEFRRLIGTATKKRRDDIIQHLDAMLRGQPPVDTTTDQDRFNREIEALRSDVRSQKNYSDDSGWEILFHPTVYQKERWDEIGKVEQVVVAHSLNMPERFPDQRTGTFATAWGIANPTYWETWALSKQGVFYFNKPFEEDDTYTIGRIREYVTNTLRQNNEYRVQRFLEQLDTYRWVDLDKNMDTIMKTFAFMRRLVEAFDEGETLYYRYCVRDLKQRYLFSFNPRRHMFLDPQYHDPCQASSPLVIEREATVEDIIANWQTYCVDVMYRFLELFPGIDNSREGLMRWLRQYAGEGTK